MEDNKALRYVMQKGWAHHINDSQIQVDVCPITGCDGGHFYIALDPSKNGAYKCHKCGEEGNLYTLLSFLGDRLDNVTSMRDVALARGTPAPMPDIAAAQRKLMAESEYPNNDNTALDYLVQRGFTMEVIERYKLGLVEEHGQRWLVIPYFSKGSLVYVKFRSLPPDEKGFRGIQGREQPLFNQDALTKGMEEVFVVEGECDALACLSNGIECVVGVPGANTKKAAWIKQLDDLAPKKIYLLYDSDKVGQNAAKDMAKRIGIDKVVNILLPEFTFTTSDGEEKQGKDINEWFRAGHTAEDFAALKAGAKPFDVDGIQAAGEVVEELRDTIIKRGSLEPKWKASEWESFNRRLCGYEPGDLVGVLAEEKRGKTTFVMNILDFLNRQYNEPVLMYCQEMMPTRMVRKWVAYATDTDDKNITIEVLDAALGIAANREADYLFGYTKSLNRKDVFDTIRQAVRRYGVKFVCFDNLQLLCRSQDNVAQETSATTKEFKQLAMELGIVIFLIMQPNAVREGEIVSSRKVYGSSAPGKDVDAMVCLHRNREGNLKEEEFAAVGFMEIEENFAPELLTRVDLSRYSAGGVTTLLFDGGKSKVTEFTPAQVQQKQSLMPVDPTSFVQPQQYAAA